MGKSTKDRTRRETVERMRREAQAAERKRTMLIVAACAAVALLIVGLAAWTLWDNNRQEAALAGEDLASLGVPAARAGCTPVETMPATGSTEHLPEGTAISYDQAPPAFGPHYAATAPFGRNFYTPGDRPGMGNLVHNLEHGYTILWYDEALADDAGTMATLEAIAEKAAQEDATGRKFIVAPYTSDDSGSFPDGKQIALTHWSATWQNGLPANQQGVTQYCTAPSGEVVSTFIQQNPYTESPEPDAA